MTYFVKDITTIEGTAKKAFYRPLGMESFDDGTTVQVRSGVGEFSEQELIELKASAQSQVDIFTEMLSYFK